MPLLYFLLIFSIILPAQTRVSVRGQARDFDLSQASSSRPAPVLTTLPATCSLGEVVIKADAPAGRNLYVCTSTDTWSEQGGGVDSSAVLPFTVSRTNGSTLSLGNNCQPASPCLTRVGAEVYRRIAPAVLTVVSGFGMAYIYMDETGELTAGSESGGFVLSCSGCRVAAGVTGFPPTSLPLWTWVAIEPVLGGPGQWETNGGIDRRASLSAGRRFLPGPNISITESGSAVTIGQVGPVLPAGSITSDETLRIAGEAPASAGQSLFGLGDAIAGGSTAGTYFGIHASAGFGGDLARWQSNGETRFLWSKDGEFSAWRPGQAVTWWGNRAGTPGSDFRLAMGASTGAMFSLGAGSSRDFLRASAEGKVSMGSTAPSPATADLLVQDATATTGDTQMQIQAGAGQSRDLLQLVNAAGLPGTRFTAAGSLVLQPEGTKPACGVSQRGAFWYNAAATGSADTVEVCRKTGTDSYVWVAVVP
jgi:hypothetical protein